jgi:hypothetical protein
MEASQTAGLVGIARYDYSSLADPRLYESTQAWIVTLFNTLVPVAVQTSNPEGGKEAVQNIANGILDELEIVLAAGAVPDIRIGIVVGQNLLN